MSSWQRPSEAIDLASWMSYYASLKEVHGVTIAQMTQLKSNIPLLEAYVDTDLLREACINVFGQSKCEDGRLFMTIMKPCMGSGINA